MIQSQYEPDSCGCDVHTNYIQESNKDAHWTINISHVKRVHTTRGYEGDGPRDPHKTTKRKALCAINLIKEKDVKN